MSEWMLCCAEKSRGTVARALSTIDADARVLVAVDSDDLRVRVARSAPGQLGVVVGPTSDGVSDINLAAAVANDGNARCVVLVQERASGSVRSRAARAGIDLVIDASELPPEPERGHNDGADGGPSLRDAPWTPASAAGRDALPAAPVLVVCSGRGGVGKTTFSAVASCVAARWGMRPCLIDLDLSCGNAKSCFGSSGRSDLSSLWGTTEVAPEMLRRLCVPAAPGVSVVGPCDRPETAELAAPYASAVIELAAREFDLVIVDTSTTFTDAVAQAVQLADRLVIVSGPGSGAVSSLARMSGLAIRLGVARTKIARLENRADARSKIDYSLGRAEVGLEAARAYRVFDGGREVADLLAAGQAYDLSEPGYLFSDSVGTTLAQLLAELGCLPEREEAQIAAEGEAARRPRSLFGLRRAAR